MKIFIKISLTILACSLCMSAMAANRFIIKYKPNESQTSFLLEHEGADKKKARAHIRTQMMEGKISNEKRDVLSTASRVRAKHSHSLATGAHVITLSEHLDKKQTEQFISNVKQDNSVEYIVEDKIAKPLSVPTINSTYQWDMVNLGGFAVQLKWSGDNFVNAWNVLNLYGYIPGENVVVAVVDTGYTPHPNFINNLQTLNGQTGIYGYKFIADCRISGECPTDTLDNDAKANSKSRYTPDGIDLGDFLTDEDIKHDFFKNREAKAQNSSWHGSHVTGTVIGSGYSSSNPLYMTGGAYGATSVPVRALGKSGGYDSDIINGMSWAAGLAVLNVDGSPVPVNANPAQVISMSLGGPGSCSAAYQDAIDNVVAEGAVIVVAAGNEKSNVNTSCPANCNNVISVAAKGPTGVLASYSNYGATTITASGGDDTINEPLSEVYSTIWSSLQEYQSTSNGGSGTWGGMDGTSMATPHVSAAVADLIGVFKAQGKTYTSQGIANLLQKTATTYNNCSSYGCATNLALDASAAVSSLLAPAPTASSPSYAWVIAGGAAAVVGTALFYML